MFAIASLFGITMSSLTLRVLILCVVVMLTFFADARLAELAMHAGILRMPGFILKWQKVETELRLL